jgi:hypothetical protein
MNLTDMSPDILAHILGFVMPLNISYDIASVCRSFLEATRIIQRRIPEWDEESQ